MINPSLHIGLRLELTRKDDLRVYVTRVEDISHLEFAVGVPFGSTSAEVFHPGEEIFCWFGDKEDQALWGFAARVLRREVRRIPLYYISMPTNFERVQRRNFFRLPTLIQAQYRLLGENHWYKAFVIDISGGGVRLSHRDPLAHLDMVQVTFALHKSDSHFLLQGQVMRVERVDSAGILMYHTGIKFINLPMSTQDRLVGYVFARLSETKRFRGE
ncbi:MAG: PilZ domain-containing protein [Firmicutes bacterium]|nr:PilZ domain-containing protein [Dethiobacter sp.]MBS3888656.1 PilZ domain-containing protein [Bacillota bacterium]